MPEQEKEVVTTYMPESIARRVEEYAEAEDLSRSKAVADIVQDAVAGNIWRSKVFEAISKITRADVRALRVGIVTDEGIETVSAARDGDELDREIDTAMIEVAMARDRAVRTDSSLEEVFEHYQMLDEEHEWATVVDEGGE